MPHRIEYDVIEKDRDLILRIYWGTIFSQIQCIRLEGYAAIARTLASIKAAQPERIVFALKGTRITA